MRRIKTLYCLFCFGLVLHAQNVFLSGAVIPITKVVGTQVDKSQALPIAKNPAENVSGFLFGRIILPCKPTHKQPLVLEAELKGAGKALSRILLKPSDVTVSRTIKKATIWVMCNGQYQKVATFVGINPHAPIQIQLKHEVWNPEKIKLVITDVFYVDADNEFSLNLTEWVCLSNSNQSDSIATFETKKAIANLSLLQKVNPGKGQVQPYRGTLIPLRTITTIPAGIAALDNDADKLTDGKNYGEKTEFHTPWNGINRQPITIESDLDGVGKQLDAIILDQRFLGTGGIIKQATVWVMTDGVYRKVANLSPPCKNERVIIEPEEVIVSPQKIKLVITDTYTDNGNYTVCLGELACVTYPKNSVTRALINKDALVFKDPLCTALKPGMKRTDIDSMNVPVLKQWALFLLNNTYQPDSLTVTIPPLLHPDALCDSLHINSTLSLYDGITGIELPKGENLIMVDAPDDADLKFVSPRWTFKPKSSSDKQDPKNSSLSVYGYNLKKGPNYFSIAQNQLAYIQYYTKDNPENHPPIKVHFPAGRVNGSFDLRKGDTNDDFKRLCMNAVNPILDVRGRYVQLAFPFDSIQKYTSGDIVGLLAVYDTIIGLQRDFTGLNKQRIHFNNSILYRVAYNDYMFTSQNTIGICDTVMKEALNPNLVYKTWGIFDEAGHVFQLVPQLTWGGMVEVSNNIATLYSRAAFGLKNLLSEGDIYAKARKAILGKGISYMDYPGMGQDSLQGNFTNTPILYRLVPFWQLYLYFKEQGYPNFFADMMIAMRKQPRWLFGREKNNQFRYMLEFCRLACEVSKTDLTEFFERWGFFYVGRQVLGDYELYQYNIKQQDIEAVKKEIAIKKYPKPQKDISMLED